MSLGQKDAMLHPKQAGFTYSTYIYTKNLYNKQSNKVELMYNA